MSLNNEEIEKMLKKLEEEQQNLADTAQNILSLLTLVKDEWSDNLTEQKTEILEKLQQIAAFQKNILEPNQQTTYQSLSMP